MKIAYAVFLSLLLTLAFPAFSADLPKDYDPAETRCGFDDASLKNVIGQLDYADQVLPNIPPEEDRYLTAESAAAKKVYDEELRKNNWKTPLQGQGNMRYGALEARPLYAAWNLRKELVEAKGKITEILKPEPVPVLVTYRKNPEAEKLERATRALLSITTYSLRMQDFLTRQNLAPNNAMITSDQWTRLYSGALTLNSDLGYYMSCKLAKIMGRQSFN
ncbi:hypothetical protein [Burkholderia sp. Se-20378]|uniref:hypothetical protein n=1 Tax=Burkholderia sp. Se-20378 TaxID=2703899 RepID=UPI001980735C|nr:hypothetical protein [Burkholderia sp. Se-20378]MBN3770720.1 hypothetical protein [Burkholderia sp. Se-20378]